MRNENNFISLLKEKKIVIPIIQRDYAQGRKNEKARLVRERLIDDWIRALNNNENSDENRVDFNYIYGNATQNIFYPVDGQQRLTSLYLLYWYLAFANDSQEVIKKWKFEYQTRNSALEFFSFLKDTEKSIDLYLLLSNENPEEKENRIKNKSWFKEKWENDPTITACIQFLITLTNKLKAYKREFKQFWDRLMDEKSAVYFTYLTEDSEEHAEINAAKKYTRMNARGKKLTEFENLKAIIDEIENNEIDNLAYCTELSEGVVFQYDKLYIQKLYRVFQNENSTLNDIVFNINIESIEWLKTIYKIYCYLYNKEISSELEKKENLYEEIMYNISQKRIPAGHIHKYLYMLKAVYEVLYNHTENGDIYTHSNFENDRQKTAFVLFVYHMWKNTNTEEDNLTILKEWKRFKNMLEDLNYTNWENEDLEFANMMNNLLEQMAKEADINEYLVNHDFKTNNPLKEVKLDDIQCRIEEQQVKAKLLMDKVIDNYTYFDAIKIANGRFGFFLFITDCMEAWKKGVNMKDNQEKIESYLKIFVQNELSNESDINDDFLKTYAYASQCNSEEFTLHTQEEINQCNNEHIWRGNAYLYWNDNQEEIEKEMIQIQHLRTTMKLIDQYIRKTKYSEKGIFKKFIENINKWFENHSGYEKCWLRVAIKNEINTKEILGNELENKNEIVMVKTEDISIILKIYLLENSYHLVNTQDKKIDTASSIKKKIFCNNKAKIYRRTEIALTFDPNPNNDDQYRHSKHPEMYLAERGMSRNLDLEYEANINIQDEKYVQGKVFSYEHLEKGIGVAIYEIGNANNNQVEINISKAMVDFSYMKLMEKNKKVWESEYKAIKNSRQENYDKWIELWYLSEKNNQFEFFNQELPGIAKLQCKGGQRPRRKWVESINVKNLHWKNFKEQI